VSRPAGDPATVQAAARAVLEAGDVETKRALAAAAAEAWSHGALTIEQPCAVPPLDRPARPARPLLLPPGKMPRRRLGSTAGRVALLHAVAHIELNAIDLAFDLIARFAADPDVDDAARPAFISDWIGVGADEARHFGMLNARLSDLDAAYGDLPAHDGLWQAAESTRGDLAARLAVAPMVLEARGLDVTPGMIERFKKAGDMKSAAALEVIYQDEIGHVAAGARWFEHVCARRGRAPAPEFQRLVGLHFSGEIKPPFNHNARSKAGLAPELYDPAENDCE
jgi:uncharacterized ferritin-like protein (DUF455 family)